MAKGLALAVMAGVCLAFAWSLLPRRTPMITRYALIIEGSLSEAQYRYTRTVTWGWVLLLATMTLVKLFDWSYGVLAGWEWLGLLVMALFLTVEFYWRRWRFKPSPPQGLVDFLDSVSRIPLAQVLRFDDQQQQIKQGKL
jgi:uncharacterized membrane protein